MQTVLIICGKFDNKTIILTRNFRKLNLKYSEQGLKDLKAGNK